MALRSAATVINCRRRLVYKNCNLFVYGNMNNGTKDASDCFLFLILATDASVYSTKEGTLIDWELYDCYLYVHRYATDPTIELNRYIESAENNE